MNKSEFLDILRECLKDEIAESEVKDSIAYYDEYITDEQKLEQLGNPRLIAKTIINSYKVSAASQFGSNHSHKKSDYQEDEFGYNHEQYESNQNNQTYEQKETKMKADAGHLIYRVLGSILLILVLIVVVALGGVVLSILVSVVFPVLIVAFMIKLIAGMTRHR